MHKYGLNLTKFLISIIRSLQNSGSEFQYPLTGEQREYAEVLKQCCKDDKEIIPALHQLSLSLFTVPPFEIAIEKWKCNLMCFLALENLREDGSFVQAHHLTSSLAQWEYNIRAVTLYEADRTQKDYETLLLGCVFLF